MGLLYFRCEEREGTHVLRCISRPTDVCASWSLDASSGFFADTDGALAWLLEIEARHAPDPVAFRVEWERADGQVDVADAAADTARAAFAVSMMAHLREIESGGYRFMFGARSNDNL